MTKAQKTHLENHLQSILHFVVQSQNSPTEPVEFHIENLQAIADDANQAIKLINRPEGQAK